MTYCEIPFLQLEEGYEGYGKNDEGSLVVVRVVKVDFWVATMMSAITLLPMRFRGRLAQWVLQHGLELEIS